MRDSQFFVSNIRNLCMLRVDFCKNATSLKSSRGSQSDYRSYLQPLPLEKTRFCYRDNLAAYISIGKFLFISSFSSGIISCKAFYWIKTRESLSIVSIRCSNREISNIFNLINAHSRQMLQVRTVRVENFKTESSGNNQTLQFLLWKATKNLAQNIKKWTRHTLFVENIQEKRAVFLGSAHDPSIRRLVL